MESQDWKTCWSRRGTVVLRAFLLGEWDPIGVKGIPGAADEYGSYIPALGRILRDGGGIDALAKEPGRIRTQNIGLPAAAEQDRAAALEIFVWYDLEIEGRRGHTDAD